MPAVGPALRFAAVAVLVFVAIALAVPRWAYGSFFRAGANLSFAFAGTDVTAKLEPLVPPDGPHDIRMHVGRRSRGFPTGLNLSSTRQGLVPTAIFLALVLASPVGWPRRRRALWIGLVLIHLFILFRVWISAATGFAVVEIDGERLLALGPFGMRLLHLVDQVAAGDLQLTYVVPALVWLVVTIRPEDLDRFRETRSGRTGS